MTSPTGLSRLDVALLRAVGEGSDFEHSSRVLGRLPDELEYGELAAYSELCALATPWTALLPLLEPNGNFGTPGADDPPSDASYTEVRLTPAGRAAFEAERGDGPPIPLGLVLGDWFRGGRRPSFDPARVADAVLAAADGNVVQAVARLGLPAFPGGLPLRAGLGGDPRSLEYGWAVRTRIDSRIEVGTNPPRGRQCLDIVALPPGMGSERMTSQIGDLVWALRRAGGVLPIEEVEDHSNMREGTRVRVILAPGADLAEVAEALLAMPSVVVELDLQLPRPLAEILARWVGGHGRDAARAGAEVLAQLARH